MARFAAALVASAAMVVAACGGTPAPDARNPGVASSGTPAGGGSGGTNGDTPPSGTVAIPDAGPTTTTLALGDGGDMQGMRLSSSRTSTVDTVVDGGPHGPHQSDPGRGVSDIRAIIVAHRDEARACYDNALKNHPGIEGHLTVEWTIDPKGLVSDTSVDPARSDISDTTVANCIFSVIKQIHFNESARGYETRASYPFDFHPHSRGAAVRPDAG